MFLTVECPDELLDEVALPAVMTGAGAALEHVEEVPAGPWLAALVDLVDVDRLSEWDLPAYVRACGKLQAWAAAQLSDGVAELASRPGGFGADKEVALALREPVGAAQRRIHHARRLRRLPRARCLFDRGELDQRHVDALVEATGSLGDSDLIAAVEDTVLSGPRALSKTAVELRRDTRTAINRLDPDGAQDRARAAREQADVTLMLGEDGMATTMVDAPVEQAVAVKTAADAYAATRKSAGDARRIGVLRAEGLARICADYLAGSSPLAGGCRPRSGGRPIEIGIVVGLDTALGRRDLPGEVPGIGIVPRDVIAQLIHDELPRLRLMIIDETTGRLVYRAVGSYRPTAEQVAHIRAEYVFSVGPGSHVLAGRTDTDHWVPHPNGPTQIGNLLPNDRTWHNGHTRRQLSVTVDDTGTVTWTSVLGQSRTVTPYDYRTGPPPSDPVEVTSETTEPDDPPPF